MYVKPQAGLLVRDPVKMDALPPEGREVPRTTYWLRKVRFGEVIEAAAPRASKKPQAED